jgi:hypothetical protein
MHYVIMKRCWDFRGAIEMKDPKSMSLYIGLTENMAYNFNAITCYIFIFIGIYILNPTISAWFLIITGVIIYLQN